MNPSLPLRIALGLSAAGFLGLAAWSTTRAIDDAEQARYARDLRRLQALDTGLNEAVLKSRSGLLLKYDPVVAALGEIRRLHASLEHVPAALGRDGVELLRARLGDCRSSIAAKEDLVEGFKMENSVVQTSLHYFPVIATSVIDRARKTPAGSEVANRMEALMSSVMLFEAAPEQEALARVENAQNGLRGVLAGSRKPGLEQDALVAVAHSRVIVERNPKVDAVVQRILAAPTQKAAVGAEQAYAALYRAATDASLTRKQWLFALALAVVVLGLTEVIIGIRRSAKALERVTDDLTLANLALSREHEKERQLGELRNRFVAMTSHEFRTPLTAIVSSAELLQQFGERWDAERRLDHVQRVRVAAGSMQRMLEDVLMIGRAEAGRLRALPSPIRLDEFCRHLVETLEHSTKKSHQIRYTFLGDPDVTMDERLLQHVLGNLLGNAMKYSAVGSEIHFDVRTSGEECHFSVADRGIGIPPAELPTLFMSFSRASNAKHLPGTGLGLAVVKRALEVQHGSIEVTSELGQGTSFLVRIPRRLAQVDTTLTPE
jgi:signal transduction histidine kinase